MSTFPQSNRTWQIIDHARQHDYAVGAYCVYVDDLSTLTRRILIAELLVTNFLLSLMIE